MRGAEIFVLLLVLVIQVSMPSAMLAAEILVQSAMLFSRQPGGVSRLVFGLERTVVRSVLMPQIMMSLVVLRIEVLVDFSVHPEVVRPSGGSPRTEAGGDQKSQRGLHCVTSF